MREIKFRAWDGNKMLSDREVVEMAEGYMSINDVTNVMQFTGLKDKNGKEIYEGDIVIGRSDDSAEVSKVTVEWDEKMSGWKPFNYFSTNGVNHIEDAFFDLSTCEVIGNIYENPELLGCGLIHIVKETGKIISCDDADCEEYQ